MLVNRSAVAEVFRNLTATFNKALAGNKGSMWRKIAMRVPSGSAETLHQWVSRFPQMREWIGEKELQQLRAFKYAVQNKDFETTIEVQRNDIEDDNLGIYAAQAMAAGESAGCLPDDLVMGLVNDGFQEKCFDGKAFFSTQHPHAGKAAFSNKGTKALDISTLDKAKESYGAARTAMRLARDDAGRPLNVNPTILLTPPALEDTANALVTVDRLEDGKANIYKGTATVMCDARLTSATAWFLIDGGRSVKPFIYQERKAPKVVQLTGMDSDQVFLRKSYLFGAEARAAGAYGFPQFAYGSTGEA